MGDKLKQADGTLGEVRYVNTVQETRTMYNLEVEEAHTFFVGTQGWLVHNGGSTKIDYGSGLSEFAIRYRKTMKLTDPYTNIALFKYYDPKLKMEVIHPFTSGGGLHSEEAAIKWLNNNDIDFKNVT